MIGIKVTGNRGVIRRLKMQTAAMDDIVAEEIISATVNIQDLATAEIAATSTDLGFLKNSIQQEFSKKDMEGQVFTNIHYAPYVEFGTGTLVDVPAGLEDYAIQYKGEGIREVNLPARPFLFPNFRSQSKLMVGRINRRISKIL